MRESETERRGVDITVAMSSKATMLKAASSSIRSDVPPIPASIPAVSDLPSVQTSFKFALKQRLRPLFRALYRMLQPLVRPIAFRLRAYMGAPLEARMNHLHQAQQLVDERFQFIARELQGLRQLQQEASERLIAEYTFQVVQEIQSSRDSLRLQIKFIARELQGLRQLQQEASEQLIAAHAFEVFQEVRSSRDSLRGQLASVANESSRVAAT